MLNKDQNCEDCLIDSVNICYTCNSLSKFDKLKKEGKLKESYKCSNCGKVYHNQSEGKAILLELFFIYSYELCCTCWWNNNDFSKDFKDYGLNIEEI